MIEIISKPPPQKIATVGHEHIHVHTHYSILDGMTFPQEICDVIKKNNETSEYKRKFFCASDHGMLAVVPSQIKVCDEYGYEPIFATELYLNPLQPQLKSGEKSADFAKQLNEDQKKYFRKSFHLLAIAYSSIGYSNLVQLNSLAWTNGFYFKPRVNHELLLKYKEGLIFTSCCYNSEIGQAFEHFGPEMAEEKLLFYIDNFKDNYYLELMVLDFKKLKKYNKFIIDMHLKYDIPLILTNDVHYAYKEDAKIQQIMLMCQTGRTLKEIEELKAKAKFEGNDDLDFFELQDTNLWFKSEQELNDKWQESYSDVIPLELFQQAKRNTVLICEKAKGIKLDRSLKLPELPNADDDFIESVWRGFKERGLPKNQECLDRLKEEISLIVDKKFSSYFLIQKMMTDEARRYCRENLGSVYGTEATGPGRGCICKDTPIVLSDGTLKPLQDIAVGDLIVTSSGTVKPVVRTFKYPIRDEVLLNIKNYYGDPNGVTMTKDHKVLVGKNPDGAYKYSSMQTWKRADQLCVGEWVFTPKDYVDVLGKLEDSSKWLALENGVLTRIRSIEEVSGITEVYDIEVEGDDHSYLTSSFVVHNSVAGSLAAYCLKIHDVNPMSKESGGHDLLFSRFLSPNRGRQMKIRFSGEPIKQFELD